MCYPKSNEGNGERGGGRNRSEGSGCAGGRVSLPVRATRDCEFVMVAWGKNGAGNFWLWNRHIHSLTHAHAKTHIHPADFET